MKVFFAYLALLRLLPLASRGRTLLSLVGRRAADRALAGVGRLHLQRSRRSLAGVGDLRRLLGREHREPRCAVD